jgi:hypothetical protein
MAQIVFKQVTELTLRNGEKLNITVAEGNSARQAKASERSKSIMFPSLKNRMIDSSFIVDIQDKSVEDSEATRKLAEEETKRALIASGLLPPQEDQKYMPGYISFIVASIKLRKRSGGGIAQIKANLDEKQLKMVNEKLEAIGLESI